MSNSGSNGKLDEESMDTSEEVSIEITIGGQLIKSSKQKLIQKSDYFRRLLIDEKIVNKITISETSIENFKLVLQISLEDQPMEKIWQSMSSWNRVYELIRVSNKYEFNETERQISQRFQQLYPKMESFLEFSFLTSCYKKSIEDNLQYLPQIYLKIIDENAAKVVELLENELVLKTFPEQLLIDIFSRDTFGVQEMSIYYLVERFVRITQNYNLTLIKTIRVSKMDNTYKRYAKYINDSHERQFFDLLWHLSGKSVVNNRICCQPNTLFPFNDNECQLIKVPPNAFQFDSREAKAITFTLPIETQINFIKFKTNFDPFNHTFPSVYYYCQVCVNDQWIKVFDCTRSPCFSTQELYFEKQIVSAIRLVGITSEGNDFWLNFENKNLLFYGLMDKTLDIKDNSIVPNFSYLSKSSAICLIDLNKTYDITDYLLKDKPIFNPKIDFSNNCSQIVYTIRLTQPVFVNCLELVFINNFEKSIKFSVSYGSEAIDTNGNGKLICDPIECSESEFSKNFDFVARHMIWIRIWSQTKELPLLITNCRLYYKREAQKIETKRLI